jgi:outer membrane lipoprotein-sorting protein
MMRIERRPLFALASLTLLLALPAAEGNTPGAEQILARAEERFGALADYQVLAEGFARVGDKTEAGSCRLWFKSPKMLRVHVLKGRDRGSQVALDRAGVLRGRKGGILKAIVKRLDWKDKRLYSIRGAPLTDMVWGTLYAKWRDRTIRYGARCSVVRLAGQESPYELVQTFVQDGKRMRVVYRIDPATWLMTEGQFFEDEVEVERISFKEIRLNTGVGDDWFGF